MEFEIFSYIPIELSSVQVKQEKTKVGVLSVYVPSHDINIQAIEVYQKNGTYSFSLPYVTLINSKTGKKFRFPYFCFGGEGKRKVLQLFLQKYGTRFVNEYYENTQFPLKCLHSERKPLVYSSEHDVVEDLSLTESIEPKKKGRPKKIKEE